MDQRQLQQGAAGWVLLAGLGVAYVISGDFVGWNFGLAEGGWGGLLVATLLMATMYTAMVFGLAELSSTIPTAGGGYGFVRRGVRVNALCPGPVNTPLLRELFAKDPEKAARRLIHLPMGRFAEATEIANAVLFLASDESSYVNASTFLVDGGLSGAYVTPE